MYIDLTLEITPQMLADAQNNPNKALIGHLGTHFDVMDREFPPEYTERNGIVFDVSHVTGRDIALSDIDTDQITKEMFVAFYTGYTDTNEYGSAGYFGDHPQLSDDLIDALLEKHISIIGIDCPGVRRGGEHIPKDRYCADRGVFIVENLCGLHRIFEHGAHFHACTFPMRCVGITGLPCRVMAKV